MSDYTEIDKKMNSGKRSTVLNYISWLTEGQMWVSKWQGKVKSSGYLVTSIIFLKIIRVRCTVNKNKYRDHDHKLHFEAQNEVFDDILGLIIKSRLLLSYLLILISIRPWDGDTFLLTVSAGEFVTTHHSLMTTISLLFIPYSETQLSSGKKITLSKNMDLVL